MRQDSKTAMKNSRMIFVVLALACSFPLVEVSAAEVRPISARFGYFNLAAIEEKMQESPAEKKTKISQAVLQTATGKVDIVLDGCGVFFGADRIVKFGKDLSVELCERLGVEAIKPFSTVDEAVTQTLRVSYFDLQHVEASVPTAVAAREFKNRAEETLQEEVRQANAAIQEARAQGVSQEGLKSLAAELQAKVVAHQQVLIRESHAMTLRFQDLLSRAISQVARRHNTELVFSGHALFMGGDLVVPYSENLTDEIVVAASKEPGVQTGSVEPQLTLAVPDLQSEIEAMTRRVAQDPGDSDSYLNRSLCHLAKGEASLAYQDAKTVMDNTGGKAVDAKDEYKLQTAVILMSLALEKSNDHDNAVSLLTQAKSRCKKNLWPYPVIQYLNGELPESLITPPDPAASVEKYVYVAFKKLLQGKSNEATANFRSAQNCRATQTKAGYKKVATAMLSILSQ